MLDPSKSNSRPPEVSAEGTLASPTESQEADREPRPEPLPRSPTTDEPFYSIRVADSPGTPCAACGKQETGAGPVGYLSDKAICDLCLLEGYADLGLMLALVAVVRTYASTGGGTPEEHRDALQELGAFARVYHRAASKSWPARTFHSPGITGHADAKG